MVRVRKDLTGMRFGRLVVMYQTNDYINSNTNTHRARWHCKCDCGNECDVSGYHLTEKTHPVRSCGCLQKDICKSINTSTNYYDINDEYAIGYTAKNEEYWVDKDMLPILKLFCWRYNNSGYVIADNKVDDPLNLCKDTIFLHVLVMGGYDENINPLHLKVDHKNHPPKPKHKVDNRKCNLRFATISENSQNQSLRSDNHSGVTGISYNTNRNKWLVRITVNKKTIFLGEFENFNDAIKARKEAEIKYFGEYRYDAYNSTEQNDLRNEEAI